MSITLYYQGHGSYRLDLSDGRTVYVDPFAGDGYDLPADLVLITHSHADHNRIELIRQKKSCTVITEKDALRDGKYQCFDVNGIGVRAVQAYNGHHDINTSVGYIITFGNVSVYASGDTSKTEEMAEMAQMNLTCALFPIDGLYNMGPNEAAECARLVRAKYSIPIHMSPGKLFDAEAAQRFHADGRVILEPGRTLLLE